MIADPAPWKAELRTVAERLEARTKQTRWTHRTDVLLERDVVIGAYAARKLLRRHPASEALGDRRVPVRRFDTDTYDVVLSRRDTVTAADLCDQIVNNTVFAFYCGETGDLFDGIYVSCDPKERDVVLVIASDFIALCNDLGTENG